MKDDDRWDDDDEVVEPDDVFDPDEDPQAPPVGRAAMVRSAPDKWSRWSMYAGIASLALIVLFPMPLLVVALATAGLWFGFKTHKRLAESDDPERARKRARTGIITGGMTMVGLLGLVLYFNFFYEVPEKIVDFS